MSKLNKSFNNRKHFLVLSYNPTLGDSILICRLLNVIRVSHPEAIFSVICHPKTLEVYKIFASFADHYVVRNLFLRNVDTDLHILNRLIMRIGLSCRLFYLQFKHFSRVIILGPDWFSRVSFRRSHKSVLSFLFSRKKDVISTFVTDSYLVHNFQEFASEGIITKSFHNTFMSNPYVSVSDSQSQLEAAYVCVITGAGNVERDLIFFNIGKIRKILKKIGLDFVILEGSSREISFEEKITLIANSSMVLCNDTGWYHVADAFQMPIICLTQKKIQEFDGYVREKQGNYVLRPLHEHKATNCRSRVACPSDIPSHILESAIRELYGSLA